MMTADDQVDAWASGTGKVTRVGRQKGMVLMGRLIRSMIVTAALLLLAAAPAAAQEYPPTGGNLNVSSGTVDPGGSVTVSGTGCAPSANVALAVDDAAAGSTTADNDGAFSHPVEVPSNASGSVELTATCDEADGGVLELTATVSIQSAGGGIPFTGASNVFPTTLAALGILVLGTGFVIVARRRSLVFTRS